MMLPERLSCLLAMNLWSSLRENLGGLKQGSISEMVKSLSTSSTSDLSDGEVTSLKTQASKRKAYYVSFEQRQISALLRYSHSKNLTSQHCFVIAIRRT